LAKRPLRFGPGARIVLLAIVVIIAWAWIPQGTPRADCAGTSYAAWSDVSWNAQPVERVSVAHMASGARARRLTYLYPYLSYLRKDGTFSPSYDHADAFVAEFRRADSRTKLLAWVGLPLTNDRPIGVHGWVDLDDPATRAQIVAFVAEQVRTAGYDGVHLNAEPVPNRSAGYLKLLEELRSELGPNKLVSVAVPHWVPVWLNAIPPLENLRWTSDYYQAVSERADQLVTMSYDSLMPVGWLYQVWMRIQVRGIARALRNSQSELLIGISVSREHTRTHNPAAENLTNGLKGVCAADRPQDVDGVAIYADWEFDPADQAVWEAWLSK